jgi:LacI family transcriptional regulator
MGTAGRPTQVDVARLAGVSRQTVSLVVLGDPRVSDRSRRRVTEAMEALGYRPNLMARALASRRTAFLGIVLGGLANPFHADLAEELRRAGATVSFIPILTPVEEEATAERTAVEGLLEMGCAGLILVSPMMSREDVEQIASRVPTVLLTHARGPSDVDLVHSDDWGGEREVARHLVIGGWDPVIYLGYDRGVEGDSSSLRLAGYRSFMKEAGLPDRHESVSVHGDSVAETAAAIAQRWDRGFALACHNDLIALHALGTLSDRGLRPGEDFAVAGYDNTSVAGFPGIGLTSVDQDTAELARRAVELLDERINGRTEQRDVTTPVRLVPRRSTGAPGL